MFQPGDILQPSEFDGEELLTFEFVKYTSPTRIEVVWLRSDGKKQPMVGGIGDVWYKWGRHVLSEATR